MTMQSVRTAYLCLLTAWDWNAATFYYVQWSVFDLESCCMFAVVKEIVVRYSNRSLTASCNE